MVNRTSGRSLRKRGLPRLRRLGVGASRSAAQEHKDAALQYHSGVAVIFWDCHSALSTRLCPWTVQSVQAILWLPTPIEGALRLILYRRFHCARADHQERYSTTVPDDGSVRGYQRDLRVFRRPSRLSRLNIQPPDLNISACCINPGRRHGITRSSVAFGQISQI